MFLYKMWLSHNSLLYDFMELRRHTYMIKYLFIRQINLTKSFNPRKIRKKLIFPSMFFDTFFCDFSLIKTKFDYCPSLIILHLKLFKKLLIELKSCFFSAKKCEFRFILGILTHISPITILNIW